MDQHAKEAPTPSPLPATTPAAEAPTPRTLPPDALLLVPLRNAVLFPGVVSPITVGRPLSLAAVREAVRSGRKVGFLLQRDHDKNEVGHGDLYEVGTLGQVVRMVPAGESSSHVIVQGEERFRVLEFLEGWPWLVARVETIDEDDPEAAGDPEVEARFVRMRELANEAIELLPNAPAELSGVVQAIESPGGLCDTVASLLDISTVEKQRTLECVDLRARLDKVLQHLSTRVQVLRLSREIGEKTKAEFDERQREHVLREQMRQIQKELGEGEDSAEIEELKKAIDNSGMPADTLKHARKEFARLSRMGEQSAESSMVRTYLEWLTELPWKAGEERPVDIAAARAVLDEDHFGLEKIKRRILEHLAVRKLNPAGKSPILCFVGPPGVGKTSLGQSIARALGRPFQRVALGGTHDEAEIRGHRRTYIGAMPGNIVQAIRRAGSRSAVLMLDEIDKLGSGSFHGDPSSALLEVLDPEQNARFRDNYLGVDYDLSRVMFLATANVLENIPGPLRDRMEVISLAGYTEEEKVEIARRYLVARQEESCGIEPSQVRLGDGVVRSIVRDYTREAGVRNLEREVGAVMRHVAMRLAEGAEPPVAVDVEDLEAILGPRRFEAEAALRAGQPGVATGLAWTPVGGDILFLEATKVPGSGRLILTGQLGDVMKESAQTALTLAKLHVGDSLEKADIHLHVPAGATPKDGPSAGVAMFLALVSLLAGAPVRPDVAMTGEVSLRGLVLPIGGVKEKLLAALRAGITTVMIPRRNEKDLADLPGEARDRLTVVLLDTVQDALACAVPDAPREAKG